MGNQNSGFVSVATSSTAFGRALPNGQRVFQEDVRRDFLLTQAASPSDSLVTVTRNIIIALGDTSGWLSGGEVTINAGDNTKYDIAEGTGTVLDYTIETAPFAKLVEFGPFVAQAIPDISKTFTLVFIDVNGNNSATSGVLEDGEARRVMIPLSGMTHVAGTVIETVTPRTLPAIDYAKAIGDVVIEMSPANKDNNYSTNGANLQIQKTSGQTFRPHVNLRADTLNPSRFTDAAAAPAQMIRHLRDGSGGFTFLALFSDVDPNFFDDGSGTLAAMAPNKFQTQLIFWVPESGFTVVTYGQKVYNSLLEAKNDIQFQVLDIEDTLSTSTSLRSILILKTSTTSLETAADAELLPNRFKFFN